jgi:hypothetical protein
MSVVAERGLGLKVHAEVVGLNPAVRVLFARDIVLDSIGQTVNWASFDMGRDGSITFVATPLEPLTSAYLKRRDEP